MRQSTLTAFFLLLLVLLSPPRSLAGLSDFSVSHYTSENGLPQNSARRVELDKNGFLWIATEAGLVRFDGQRFRLYDKEHYPVLQSNRIPDLMHDNKGVLAFSDEFGNTYDFDRHGLPQPVPLSVRKHRFTNPRHDFFWVRIDSVHYWDWRKNAARWVMQVPGLKYEELPNRWGTLNNKFYYRDRQRILWVIDSNGNITRPRITGLLPGSEGANLKVNGLYLQGEAFYLHAAQGIYRLTEDSDKQLHATLVLKTEIQNIRSYRNYPELNLQVVGTQSDGFYLFRRKQFTTLKHSNGFGNYYPQVPLGDSGVLTDRGPVYPSSSRFDYPFRNLVPFRSLLLDSRGHYWISEGSYGQYSIVQLDQQLKVHQRFPSANTANCFRETPDGRIWLCSYIGRSMGYVDRDSVSWLPALWQYPQTVLTFLPIDNEIFWVGGIRIFARLNIKTRQQVHYPDLEKYTIETLYLDKEKVLWIGTSGNGFFALKQNRLIKMPLDNNAGLKDVHSFIEDKNGFVWMSTNNGLFRCTKKSLDDYVAGKATYIYYQCFKRESGFNTNEFNGSCTPSAITLGNGRFSFPSADGLVQFHPDSIREALPANKIFIDKLMVDGKQLFADRAAINIDPSFKYLEAQISSPYFGNAANQLLEYRLNGLDSVWHPVKEDNTVVFNNPGNGNYDLQFRKRSGFGAANIITTSIPLFVKPFFYQTAYFKVIVLIAIALLIFLVVKLRYLYLVKRNKELEQEVGQRTLKLQQANKLKEKMLMMVGHDLQSPLHFMGLLSRHVQHALEEEDLDKVRSGNEEIRTTATKIHAFVEEFGLWSRLQDESFNLSKRKFSLSAMIKELASFYKEILGQNNNLLEYETDQEYELETNRELLKAMLRNLVDNANKHTRNGRIGISCRTDIKNGLCIEVSDTGKGMSGIELNNIRRRIDNKADAFVISHTSKLGFQLIIDFALSLGIRLAVESKVGEGTSVTLSGLQVAGVLAPGEAVSGSELD